MRVLDENGIEITEPDLELGYLVDDEEIIIHQAEPAIPARYERVLDKQDPTNQKNKLYKRVRTQPYVPAKPERHEVVKFKRYLAYTPEQLAEREAQRAAEEQARKEAQEREEAEAAQRETMNALPAAFDELAGMTADNTLSIETICGAIEELAVEVSNMKGTE